MTEKHATPSSGNLPEISFRDAPLNDVIFGPLEQVDCALCGKAAAQQVVAENWFGTLFVVVRCRDCKLMFTNPRPSAEWKAHFYDPEFNPYLGLSERSYVYQQAEEKFRADAPLWACLKKMVPDGARLLDGGCSSGLLVKEALERGYVASGFDYSSDAVKDARSRFGLDVFTADATSIPVESDTYDVITLDQVFEHFSEPLESLKELRRVLKPGGLLYIETVNYHKFYLLERHMPFLKRPYLKLRSSNDDWYSDRLPWAPFDHYYHWTPPTILAALRQAGFCEAQDHLFQLLPEPGSDSSSGDTSHERSALSRLTDRLRKSLGTILVASGRKPA